MRLQLELRKRPQTLAFPEVNQAAVNHYGYSEKEFLSMTIKDIRPSEDIPRLLTHHSPTDIEFKELIAIQSEKIVLLFYTQTTH